MKKKNTKTGKAAPKSPRKTRTKKVAAKNKTRRAVSKVASTISGTKTASLKRSIRKIKTSLKQLEKAVGK